MQSVVGRLLTSRPFRARFFEESEFSSYGLDPQEAQTLRRIDPAKLEIVSEGYVGKRLERVQSAFPLTFAVCERERPGAKADYIARTRFPADMREEDGTFVEYLRASVIEPPDLARRLRDLLKVDSELQTQRLHRPEWTSRSRPQAAPIVPLESEGDLSTILGPGPYLPAPGQWMVFRSGNDIVVEAWSLAGPLLSACDGARTVDELEKHFGPGTRQRLSLWFASGLLEP